MTTPAGIEFSWIIWPFGAGRKQVGLCFTKGDPDVIFDVPTEQAETLDRIFRTGHTVSALTVERDNALAEVAQLNRSIALAKESIDTIGKHYQREMVARLDAETERDALAARSFPPGSVTSEEYGLDQVNEHVIPMRVARGWSQPHPAATHVRTVITWPDPPRPNDDWPIYRGPWRSLVITDDNEERDKLRAQVSALTGIPEYDIRRLGDV